MNITEKLPISVLIVDDEPLICEQLSLMLQRRCENVQTAMNGQDALEKLQANHYDVIVSDVDMPVMNGIELLKAVREQRPTMPFIIVTGLKNLDVLISAIEYNVTAFIPKPVQKNDLFEKLSAVSIEKQLSSNLQKQKNLLDQYKFIVDQSSLVSKTDPDGIITYVNDNFCVLSGYTREELIGQPHNIVRDPQMPSEVFAGLWNTISNKKIWRGIIHNRTKNGGTYTVKSTIAPIIDIDGNIIEFMSIREDITSLTKKDEELKAEKQKLQDILNHVDNIVAMASIEDKLLFVNQKFFDQMPYRDYEHFKSKHQCICDCFAKEEGFLQPLMDDEYWIHYVLDNPQLLHKAKIIDQNNQTKVYSVSIQPVNNDQKEVFVITLSDITQLEKAKEDALSAAKAKSDFLANMSHEIRTPMNGILGFAKLLEKTELNEKQKKYIDIINSSTSSLLGIINDILDFSKLESGKFELDKTAWNPFVEFEKIGSLFTAKMEEKNIVFDRIIEPDLPECVYADLLRLQQVISNLLSNAVKFTPEGGTIVFYAKQINSPDMDIYRIGIRDSGIGIEPQKMPYIFDAFSQADTSITRRFGGTGLGLSISSHLVALMGSKIRVESTMDVGSDFYFDIPLQKCKDTHPISDMFNGIKVGIYESDQEDHPCQQKVITYLSKLHIPYHVRDVSELNDFISSNEIHLFFCNVPTQQLMQMDRLGSHTIIACGKTTFDFTAYRSIHSITDLDHNLSSLYNVLLSIAVEKETSTRSTNVHPDKMLRGKILVAEDNEVNRVLIDELFQSFDVEHLIVNNGEEVFQAAKDNHYDLILMDINMPIVDGVEALKLIREFDSATPVVALTANAMEGDKEKFLHLGFDGYLTKPIILKDLKTVLKQYLPNTKDSVSQQHSPVKVVATIVDLNAIREAFPLSDKVIYKLLKSYFDSCDNILEKLSQAIDEKSSEQIEQLSHMIKGSAANLRFEALVSVAAEVEQASRKKEIRDYFQLYSKIEALTKQIKSEIKELLDEQQA